MIFSKAVWKKGYANANKLFSMGFCQSLDCYATQRNLNTLVIGGPGTGKTRGFVWPNLLQVNSSYVVFDPKGESFRNTGGYMFRQGYKVKAVDYIRLDPNMSHYNPFHYLRGDLDVQKLATNIYQNTTPAKSTTNDPFWDQAGEILLKALMFMLWAEGPEDEQNFSFVLEMIRAGTVMSEEGNDDYASALDGLFEELKEAQPEHLAVQYYDSYKIAAGKTRMSIQISLIARIEKYMLPSLAAVTSDDNLELERFGEEKTVLYCLIPDNDRSFNFIIGMLYTQLFQILYYQADWVHDGALPIPVHFIMDEFANVHLPDDYVKLLTTMRSRKVFVSMILQDITQLKERYEKTWETVVAGCDTLLYLGGGGQETRKMISEKLGKETITVDSNSQNRSWSSGSFTQSEQLAGRELKSPDELDQMPNDDCIVFMRGEKPLYDRKFVLKKHKGFRRMELYKNINPMEAGLRSGYFGAGGASEWSQVPDGIPVLDIQNMSLEDVKTAINHLEERNNEKSES